MKATLTAKGQVTIPIEIRTQLGLDMGSVLDFSISDGKITIVKFFDEQAVNRAYGFLAHEKLSSLEELDQSRGPVDLPVGRPRKAKKKK